MCNPTFHVLCVLGVIFFVGLSLIKPRKDAKLSLDDSLGLLLFKTSCSVVALILSCFWPLLSTWDIEAKQAAFKRNYSDERKNTLAWSWQAFDNVNMVNYGCCSYTGIEEGDTLLIMASRLGYRENVRFLLSKGANRNIRNKRGDTALDAARRNGHKEICRLLEDQ
jgi:hypothetical protein